MIYKGENFKMTGSCLKLMQIVSEYLILISQMKESAVDIFNDLIMIIMQYNSTSQ